MLGTTTAFPSALVSGKPCAQAKFAEFGFEYRFLSAA
jgi:hypothetical protein